LRTYHARASHIRPPHESSSRDFWSWILAIVTDVNLFFIRVAVIVIATIFLVVRSIIFNVIMQTTQKICLLKE
jgi:hypothetical protein